MGNGVRRRHFGLDRAKGCSKCLQNACIMHAIALTMTSPVLCSQLQPFTRVDCQSRYPPSRNQVRIYPSHRPPQSLPVLITFHFHFSLFRFSFCFLPSSLISCLSLDLRIGFFLNQSSIPLETLRIAIVHHIRSSSFHTLVWRSLFLSSKGKTLRTKQVNTPPVLCT